MKTVSDLLTALGNGFKPVVTFKAPIEDCECYPETGMRGVVTGGRLKQDGVVQLWFDFEPFDSFNAALEKREYYDDKRQPTLTAREAGYYKPQDDVYLMQDHLLDDYFVFEDQGPLALMEEWRASGSDKTYVAWLEAQLLTSRGKVSAA